MSVGDRLRALRLTRGTAAEQKDARDRADLRLGALGSGSDYTVFLDHLGVASLNIGYSGEDEGGSYHSIYDSFDHYSRFGDPGFEYGVALARTGGRLVLRLANADLLPFDFTASADAIAGYGQEVARLADEMREETEKRNRLIREGRFDAAADPRETYVAPKPQAPVPHLNFAPLRNAIDRLKRSADDHERARREPGPSIESKRSLDGIYLRSEQALTRAEGLPRRPWFRHQIYAPGFYTGYGVKTLPGVRESIEERNWDEASAQIESTARAIERYAAEIDRAAELLRK
jgi:N-acetylated-alpha-linked acidic dipeptidase